MDGMVTGSWSKKRVAGKCLCCGFDVVIRRMVDMVSLTCTDASNADDRVVCKHWKAGQCDCDIGTCAGKTPGETGLADPRLDSPAAKTTREEILHTIIEYINDNIAAFSESYFTKVDAAIIKEIVARLSPPVQVQAFNIGKKMLFVATEFLEIYTMKVLAGKKPRYVIEPAEASA